VSTTYVPSPGSRVNIINGAGCRAPGKPHPCTCASNRRRGTVKNAAGRIQKNGLRLFDGTRWGYPIRRQRLLTLTTGTPPMYDWCVHLAGKRWHDNQAFAELFLAAVDSWGLKLDAEIWNRTVLYLRAHPQGWGS
jgi:hypothetical protein